MSCIALNFCYLLLFSHCLYRCSSHQQQSVMFSQQNPQVLMPGMQYMPYMVRQIAMMGAQPPPTPQQSAALRQTMMIPPSISSPMPPYQRFAAFGMHPSFYQAMPAPQQVPQRSDGSVGHLLSAFYGRECSAWATVSVRICLW